MAGDKFTAPELFGATYRIKFYYPNSNRGPGTADVWAQSAEDALTMWRVMNIDRREHSGYHPIITGIRMLGAGPGPFAEENTEDVE